MSIFEVTLTDKQNEPAGQLRFSSALPRVKQDNMSLLFNFDFAGSVLPGSDSRMGTPESVCHRLYRSETDRERAAEAVGNRGPRRLRALILGIGDVISV